MFDRRSKIGSGARHQMSLLRFFSAFMVAAFLSPVAARGLSAQTNNGQFGGLPNFQHVFVIMMENRSYTSLIGNYDDAPFINRAATTYGLATKYFGVTHPSQPNYIAATSGSTNGVSNDNDITVDVINIVDQLEAKGKTWKAYMQSLSLCTTGPLQHACGNQLYERKHNPFISYTDVQTDPARVAKIVDFSQFSIDLANNSVPNYSWISPDQCNDMHGRGGPSSDPCNFDNVQGSTGLIATGDYFLQTTVNQIMNSTVWQDGNSTIFIVWDESDFVPPPGKEDTSGCCDSVPGGGHLVTLVISNSVNSPVTSDLAFNHYSLLATIEGGLGLGCLAFTCDTANVKPMRDLVN